MGLARIHAAAKPECSYDDLRYFQRRFITLEALQAANRALVDCILKLRNGEIWKEGNACASDGKHLTAWDRNPTTEWNPHYVGGGVMVYWHVEKNAVCIHAQLKTVGSSEVIPMIHGLLHHDTQMKVESNYVDSGGQSELAFAVCRLLGYKLLPRLKRIKDHKLYLPESGAASRWPNLADVCARAIDWDAIANGYDEMIRHVVALAQGTGPTESILRRFNQHNRSHPVFKAFIELGKVEKTEFLCRLLYEPALNVIIHEALNGVEHWNSCNDFIAFGRKSELQTNDTDAQALAIAGIHLLQNAMVLANTLLVERVLAEPTFRQRMDAEDYRALNPLFTSNINPYGAYQLDLGKPSFLRAS